ncbi:Zinc finger, ZZ-type [Pleurostoma richardsiae]|uniref:Zinc finger, ZZ-type n=1 Tax=Pleurostoma richardsiae TaxID=41990 RepID=A0AA38RFZ2_9PEZI|nr:Zinc finger, ZZ-type [Pleurostoma richardsiae]
MDPLSLAASIAGFISLGIEITKIISDYTASVNHAEEESQELETELSALVGSLQALERFLKDHEDSTRPFRESAVLVNATLSCDSFLDHLKTTLGKFMEARRKKGWCRKLTWPLKKGRHTQTISTIQRFTQVFSLSITVDGCKLLAKTAEEVAILNQGQLSSSQAMEEITVLVKDLRLIDQQLLGKTTVVEQTQKGHEQERLLEWLSSSDLSIKHNAAIKMREPGTGLWFLESEDFCNWVSSPGFLWLYGIPGCGKTVLCSTIIEAVREICLTSDERKLAYFYFDFQEIESQDEGVLLGSLLRQLCAGEAAIPKPVQDLYTRNHPSGYQPSTEELESTLFAIIGSLEKEVYIILDALDELPEKHDSTKRREVLRRIDRMVSRRFANLHILTTSRDVMDIREKLASLCGQAISIQSSHVDADIAKYVRTCLKEDRFVRLPDYIKALIEAKLAEQADGMFRWAFCQIETLRECDTIGEIKRTLDTLPKTLDETYERILADMFKQSAEKAWAILVWLLFSARPLTLEELAEAAVARPDTIPVDPDDRLIESTEILRICRSLITVSKDDTDYYGMDCEEFSLVHFAHFSVKEYLVSERSKLFCASAETAHEFIASSCIRILLHLDFSDVNFDVSEASSQWDLFHDLLHKYPLFGYAAEHWTTHSVQIKNNIVFRGRILDDLLRLFDRGSSCFLNWLRVYDPGMSPPWFFCTEATQTVASPLFYASRLGLHEVAERLLQSGADVNELSKGYGTPLHGASKYGCCETVKILLRHGANVDAVARLYGGETKSALEVAAGGCHEDVVRLLLRANAHKPADQCRFWRYSLALQATLRPWWADDGLDRIVEVLIKHGADVNARDRGGDTTLAIASYRGSVRAVRLLLNNGADLNAPGGKEYCSALDAAVRGRSLNVFKLLLARGANPHMTGGRYGSILQSAISLRPEDYEMSPRDLLAGLGAVYDDEEDHDEEENHDEEFTLHILSQIIDLGVDVNIHGGGSHSEGPALEMASERGYEDMVRLLVARGADVNLESSTGSPLPVAAAAGRHQIVQILLDHGADVNAQITRYGTALQAAAEFAKYSIVQLLLTHGADVNSQVHRRQGMPPKYGSALQAASGNDHVDVVKLLIDSGADVNARNDDYGTALEVATRRGHRDVVQLLLQSGATHSRDALGSAPAKDHLETV